MELHPHIWLLLSVITLCSGSDTGFNDNPALDSQQHNLKWMASIPDGTPVSAVSIPGTHESLSLHGGPLTVSQVWDLDKQLQVGLRYFDLHAGIWVPTEKHVYIRDGRWMIWQQTQLDEVLQSMLNFLDINRSETVLLKVEIHGLYKEEVRELIMTLILKFKDKIWTNASVPNMKQARGKVIFLQSKTFHDGVTNQRSFFIHGGRLSDVEGKIKNIKSDLCGRRVVLTDNAPPALTNPKQLAKTLNKALSDFVREHGRSSLQRGCLGVFSVTFPSADLIREIARLKPCRYPGLYGTASV
ncbi:1-phosphatidylinositol phosphodiesterase [Brachionichthys hirsutus]|uniref:1-phosphatidylinositol phosphodiesterase n=1 Tax=Brachionichthys hirsutus TaxID=412623 RepID=UPI003604922D